MFNLGTRKNCGAVGITVSATVRFDVTIAPPQIASGNRAKLSAPRTSSPGFDPSAAAVDYASDGWSDVSADHGTQASCDNRTRGGTDHGSSNRRPDDRTGRRQIDRHRAKDRPGHPHLVATG